VTKRSIIRIDEHKCTGCKACIPNCPEGAIQVIDGKARLISDIFCDGLGACIGHCPEGAITVEERDASPYDERLVMDNIIKAGPNTIQAHLNHLQSHGQDQYLAEARQVLREKGITIEAHSHTHAHHHQCPGAAAKEFSEKPSCETTTPHPVQAQLRHWPIQLHLVSPQAPFFHGHDVLLTADCVAYALGSFHDQYLRGKSLAIACPKLDANLDDYVEKIRGLIDDAHITSLTVMIMEVPCCRGLVVLAERALERSQRKIPVSVIVVGIQGAIVKQEQLKR